ncbi:tetratricopeptide repeat protein [Actinomyces bowdenii]|uniref:tetratricopeptide repeat protein n=1 Tax=Actinomyces bowdenii TaxID=131109 RepID=UPI001ABC3CA4|nr:tetratricopeptide repeat protein [Actinomyces bowdenii]MBO3723462.1 tetratricopeptide repeat protein [Actinomyces bowdenii]
MSENQNRQDPGDQERFGPRPGQSAPGEAAPPAPSAPSPGGRAEQPSRGGAGTEDPQLRAARMRRRRRLLLLGAAPALLATAAALWCGAVFGLSMAASHALTRGDHETAVSRYRTVAAINPWLEQWRVHYNLGTALYVAADLDGAQAALETALGEVPIADEVDPGTGLKPEGSPECRVRHNLSLTHAARAAQAQESGDTAQADESAAAAQEALGQCPPPPSPDPSQSPSPDPSPQPSQTPSQGSSQDPSASPSPEPSQDPSAQPSQEPSAPPSQDPSSSPSASSSSSSSPSASASSSPDDRAERLRRRNNDESENGATRKGESQQPQDGTKPW